MYIGNMSNNHNLKVKCYLQDVRLLKRCSDQSIVLKPDSILHLEIDITGFINEEIIDNVYIKFDSFGFYNYDNFEKYFDKTSNSEVEFLYELYETNLDLEKLDNTYIDFAIDKTNNYISDAVGEIKVTKGIPISLTTPVFDITHIVKRNAYDKKKKFTIAIINDYSKFFPNPYFTDYPFVFYSPESSQSIYCSFHYDNGNLKNFEKYSFENNCNYFVGLTSFKEKIDISLYSNNSPILPVNLNMYYENDYSLNGNYDFDFSYNFYLNKQQDIILDNDGEEINVYRSPIDIIDALGNNSRFYFFDEVLFEQIKDIVKSDYDKNTYYDLVNYNKLKVYKLNDNFKLVLTYSNNVSIELVTNLNENDIYEKSHLKIQKMFNENNAVIYTWNGDLLQNIIDSRNNSIIFNYDTDNNVSSIYAEDNKIKIELTYVYYGNRLLLKNVKKGIVESNESFINEDVNCFFNIDFNYTNGYDYLHVYGINNLITNKKFTVEVDRDNSLKKVNFYKLIKTTFVLEDFYKLYIYDKLTIINDKYNHSKEFHFDEFGKIEANIEFNNDTSNENKKDFITFYAYNYITNEICGQSKLSYFLKSDNNLINNPNFATDNETNIYNWTANNYIISNCSFEEKNNVYNDYLGEYTINFLGEMSLIGYSNPSFDNNKPQEIYQEFNLIGFVNDEFEIFACAYNNNQVNGPLMIIMSFYLNNSMISENVFKFNGIQTNYQFLIKKIVSEVNYDKIRITISYYGLYDVQMKYISLNKVYSGNYLESNTDAQNGVLSINTNQSSVVLLEDRINNENIIVKDTNIIERVKYDSNQLLTNKSYSEKSLKKSFEYDEFGNLLNDLTSYNDEKYIQNYYQYDDNLLTKKIDDFGYQTEYTYNNYRLLETVVDYLNLKYKYKYDINNYVKEIIKSKDSFEEYVKLTYDNNKEIIYLYHIDLPKYNFIKNESGQLNEIRFKISESNDILMLKYEFYDMINSCTNDLIKKKIYSEDENNPDFYEFEYDGNNNLKSITYNNVEKTYFSYDDYNRLSVISSNDNGNVYNLNIEYDLIKDNQINKIAKNGNSIQYQYDNYEAIQSEILNINDDCFSFNFDYNYEVNEYNLNGYFGLINKNTLNDSLLIIDKFNDNDSLNKLNLLYGNEPNISNVNVMYDSSINHSVVNFGYSNSKIYFKINDINAKRNDKMYYFGKYFDREKFKYAFETTKSIYAWIKPEINKSSFCELICFRNSSKKLYWLRVLEDGNLLLCTNQTEIITTNTSIKLDFDHWNLICVTIGKNSITVSCNNNQNIYGYYYEDNVLKIGNKSDIDQTALLDIPHNDITYVSIGGLSEEITTTDDGLKNSTPMQLLYLNIGCEDFDQTKFNALYKSGLKYLNGYKVTESSGVSFYNFNLYKDFEVFPLNGTLTSNKGTLPKYNYVMNSSYINDRAKIFKYEDSLKHHVFASYDSDEFQMQGHNQILAYDINIDKEGIIGLWVKPDSHFADEKVRYILDCVKENSSNDSFRLFLTVDNYLNIEYNGIDTERLNRRLIADEWNYIVIKIKNGIHIKVNSSVFYSYNTSNGSIMGNTLYLGNFHVSNTKSISYLNGYIRMLTFSNIVNDNFDDLYFDNVYQNDCAIDIRTTYDDYGRVKTKELFEKNIRLITNYEYYDELNKINPYVSSEKLPNGNRIIYSYNENKYITHKVEIDDENVIQYAYFYAYNHFNKLEKEIYYKKDNIFDYCYTYEYDSYGNIIKKLKLDEDENVLNSYVFTYDLNNPYLLKSLKKDNETIFSIEYDVNKPMFPSFITSNNLQSNLLWEGKMLKRFGDVTFTYNYDGTREKLTTPSYTKEFVTFNKKVYRLIKKYNNNSNIIINYIYDEKGIVSSLEYNGNYYYFQRDILGNINKIIDINSNVYVEYQYDAYGNPTINIPESITEQSLYTIAEVLASTNVFMYKGYIYDIETNLFLVSSRYYSPELCRWISPDDIEYLDPESVNGLNLYCYCLNNPIMYVDPDGHMPKWAQWVVGGLAVAGLIVATVLTCGAAGAGAAAVGAAMLTGGLVSAGINVVDQLHDGGSFDWTELAISTLSGTAYGLVVGLTGGTGAWAVAGKFAVAGGTSLLNSWNEWDENSTFGGMMTSFALSLVVSGVAQGAGYLTGKFGPKVLSKLMPKNPNKLVTMGDIGSYLWGIPAIKTGVIRFAGGVAGSIFNDYF